MGNDGGGHNGPENTTSYNLQPPRQNTTVPDGIPAQPAPGQQPTTPDPGSGRLIAGRYRLLSRLGHGGMGTVWRARDEIVEREVAVKEPRVPESLPERDRATVYERMRREARAAARLDHPAVVNVHDVAIEDGQPWIVLEFVRGRSLGDALQEGTLDAREASRIGLQVLGALNAAHEAGVLHRDVKPDNVMLGRHGRVVLTDFGIAQVEGETKLTDTGVFVGSPEFIAPERILGQRPGPASDLWSLGVVLYAATEGVSPFRRNTTPATLQSVLNSTPAAPAAAKGPLATAINGLLRKDPNQRPSAAVVQQLLEEAAQPPRPTRNLPVPGTGGRRGIRLSRKVLLALGATVVAAVAVLALVITDPFAGKLPGGWATYNVKRLGATVAVPDGYTKSEPSADDSDQNWVTFTDPSGAIWVGLHLDRKSEDTYGDIAGTATAEAYDDMEQFKDGGNSGGVAMADDPAPKGKTDKTSYQGREAAQNSVTYASSSDENLRPREAEIFYYKTESGDMYRLWVDYPGKGDFTARGREVASTVIDNLEIQKL